MKKFIMMIALAFSMIAMQSCKDTQFGVTYSLTATGDAVGNVQFNVPVGHFAVNGDADLDVLVSNDTTPAVLFGAAEDDEVFALGEALESNETDVLAASTAVEGWLQENFSVNDAGGDYYIHIVGFVRENLTGLTFSVDKVFSNRDNPPTE